MAFPLRNAASLPCHYSNKGNRDRLHPIQSNHCKSAFALAWNIEFFFENFGVDRCICITLTLPEAGLPHEEIQKRYKSIRTGVLDRRYQHWLCVVGFGSNGRMHFHIIAVGSKDVRTDCDFPEYQRRKRVRASAVKNNIAGKELRRLPRLSANPALRAEWSFWRDTAKAYGFGRVEAMPVRIPLALNRYLCRHLWKRTGSLKEVRRVRYSRGWRRHSCLFSFVHGTAQLWRRAAAEFFYPLSRQEVQQLFGSHWARHLESHICFRKRSRNSSD
jgi:hypothetical protein